MLKKRKMTREEIFTPDIENFNLNIDKFMKKMTMSKELKNSNLEKTSLLKVMGSSIV